MPLQALHQNDRRNQRRPQVLLAERKISAAAYRRSSARCQGTADAFGLGDDRFRVLGARFLARAARGGGPGGLGTSNQPGAVAPILLRPRAACLLGAAGVASGLGPQHPAISSRGSAGSARHHAGPLSSRAGRAAAESGPSSHRPAAGDWQTVSARVGPGNQMPARHHGWPRRPSLGGHGHGRSG